MKRSALEFRNPELTRLTFDIHENFSKSGTIEMNIHLDTKFHRGIADDGSLGNKARVKVILAVGEKDDSTPFYIEAEEAADFEWEEGAFEESEVKMLLEGNAVALLISYLRPLISNITAASPYPAYNLPYIDLTSRMANNNE